MSISDMRKRLARVEKRSTRTKNYVPTDLVCARWMGWCIYCAAHGHGSECHRDLGRHFAIGMARERAAGRGNGGDLPPWLAELLLRILVGGVLAADAGAQGSEGA